MSTEDRSEPPPEYEVDGYTAPFGAFAKVRPGSEPYDEFATREEAVAACWAHRDAAVAPLQAEIASLRARLASLGDDFNAERAARQALLQTAWDRSDVILVELERQDGEPITTDDATALVSELAEKLAALGFKAKTWGSAATMRLAFGGDLARQALSDALDRLRGVRHG